MFETRQFDAYRLTYGRNDNGPYVGLLLYEGMTQRGMVAFHPDGQPMPSATWEPNSFVLRYRLSQFGDVMSILREEKPLFAVHVDAANYNGIATTSEQIGGHDEP